MLPILQSKQANRLLEKNIKENITRDTLYTYPVANITSLRLEKFYNICSTIISAENSTSLYHYSEIRNSPMKLGLVSEKFKVVVYINRKAGCSSWIQGLVYNTNDALNLSDSSQGKYLYRDDVLHNNGIDTVSRLLFKSNSKMVNFTGSGFFSKMKGYYSVLTVRHPLAR